MSKLVMASFFACVAVFGLKPATAHAGAVDLVLAQASTSKDQNALVAISKTLDTTVIVPDETEILPTSTEDPEPEKKTYKIEQGDTLIKIAHKFNVAWQRLYDRNTTIEDPDVLIPGMEIVIPTLDEELPVRPIPENALSAVPVQPNHVQSKKTAVQTTHAVSSAGNLYTKGYCTWYVKNRRPDLPNNLGNAATWVTRAAAQGISTGSAPRIGAVGQRNNHVVYVEAVNDDGTITISEMNYRALYEKTTRTVPASYFAYIY